MRYIKLIAAIIFVSIIFSNPQSVRAQETEITTLEVAPGCTLTKQTYLREATRSINSASNGVIVTTWTERGAQNPAWGNAEVKAWIDPGQPAWKFYDSVVTTWTSTNCSTNQMFAEFQKNQMQRKTWNDLCGAKMTCPTPTSAPTPTPGTTICTSVEREGVPRGNHTMTQAKSGKMLIIWTGRGAQNPPWGDAEAKVWMSPGQPDWKIYDAGVTYYYSNTCTPSQLYQNFKQDTRQEVTWNQLCAAGITCPARSSTPTPTPNPSGSPTPGGVCQTMQATTLTTGNHTLAVPNANGAILTVWSGKQGVPWGAAEKKTWLNPGEQWKLFGAGGTLWTTNSCTKDQVRARLNQVQLEEKSWQQLCDAKITCQ